MAVAHGDHVWEYVAGGPFDDECWKWDLAESAPQTTEGYVAIHVSPDDSCGFIPYDNEDEIWPVTNKRAVSWDEEIPSEVTNFWW